MEEEQKLENITEDRSLLVTESGDLNLRKITNDSYGDYLAQVEWLYSICYIGVYRIID